MASTDAQAAAQQPPPGDHDAFVSKDQHSVKIVDSHMTEGMEHDVVMVSMAAVERHKQVRS